MLAIYGALAIVLAALTMLLAAALVRYPPVPEFWKGDGMGTAFAVGVTTAFGLGVTMIGKAATAMTLWQWGAVTAIIVLGALVLPIFAFRKLAQFWQDQPPKAPIVEFPKRNEPSARKAPNQRVRRRRAA